ncbi:cytochrome c [Pseudooceanicola nanhaiensis]|jgi:cytochrome c556|uniref:Cytochrome c-554 n=1 Tax=Pseudooceanicola nanhaiensis TaxID=375761 RepID=A0A917WIM0_9RHOB|nr:cytochrome c [Pseudooceanicola nanhaiensis]GGM06242.1 cytochrome c-554 [Pseudooceanicola nanhaiensis]
MKKQAITMALLLAGTAVLAHGGVKDPDVMNRMMGMSEMARQVQILGAMAKGETAFDAEAGNKALAKLSEEASYIPTLFEPEATDPKSEALPVIWEKYDRFTAHAQELERVTGALAGTIETRADLAPAMRQVGQACGACHSSFRQ